MRLGFSDEFGRPRAPVLAHVLVPILAIALLSCIADQGSSAIPLEGGIEGGDDTASTPIETDSAGSSNVGDDGGGDAVPGDDGGASDAGNAGSRDAGSQESGPAAPPSVTRKIEGMANDAWVIVDQNGKPGPDGPGTLDVPAGAKVHFILTSDPSGETHKFMIMIPNFMTANVDMPPIPGSATLDWTAPPTPNRYKNGINCTAHKGMVADIVVQ
jgi:hypothetical protein